MAARRSGIMAQTGTDALPSAIGSSGNGCFRRNRIVRSSGAESSSVASMREPPNGSRFAQRRSDATQSRASTGVPSWKRRPARRIKSQRRPSASTQWPSTICGVAR